MEHSYRSVKPLPKIKHIEPKEVGVKGMVRASVYNRKLFQSAFKKEKAT